VGASATRTGSTMQGADETWVERKLKSVAPDVASFILIHLDLPQQIRPCVLNRTD
jgi:hypothetical protein